jgi:hypothetical protein
MALNWSKELTEGLSEHQISELQLILENMKVDGLFVTEEALRKVIARLRSGDITLHEADKELAKASEDPS